MEPTANASAFSSDGRWLAATVDEKVQIQEAATGRVVQVFRGHTRDVVSIAFSDQGRWLVSASIDDTVRIWDAQAEVQVAPEGHTEMVRAIAFSHDRQLLATGSDDMTVQIWNTESGELQLHLILDGGASSITSVAFSPDGQRVASSSYDDSTRIWDVKTGKLQFTMPGHWRVGGSPECAHQVAFSHDGRLLASTCSSPEIQLWNAETGNLKLIVNLSDRQRASSVGFSHDDQRLVAGSYSNVYIWDAKTGRLQHLLKGLRDSVNALEFSSDGRYLAGSCSYPDRVCIWDADTGELWREIAVGGVGTTLSFSSDNGHLITGYGRIAVDELSSGVASPNWSGYGIDVSTTWITWNGKKIIRLPAEYRPNSYYDGVWLVKDRIIVMGCFSGRVLLIAMH
jgi:WD40 repeat protein